MRIARGKLHTWQRQQGLTDAEAGAEFGVSRMTWQRWKNGVIIPGPSAMIELYRQSSGFIQPNDFYDLPQLQSPALKAVA